MHRRAELGASLKYWVRPDIENRIKEGSIVARFNSRVTEIRPTEVVVECEGAQETLPADAVFLLTGYLADLEFLKDCGIQVDPETNIPTQRPGPLRRRSPRRGSQGSSSTFHRHESRPERRWTYRNRLRRRA